MLRGELLIYIILFICFMLCYLFIVVLFYTFICMLFIIVLSEQIAT